MISRVVAISSALAVINSLLRRVRAVVSEGVDLSATLAPAVIALIMYSANPAR